MLISPNPTNSEIDDALTLVTGCAWAAELEVLRRLRENLPAHIARKNAQLNYSANKGILVPTHYVIAPARPTDEYVNVIAVRHSIDRTPHGTDTFLSTITLNVLSVEGPARISDQRVSALQRADLIGAILYQYLGGCWNDKGQKVWSSLYPAHPSQNDLPDGWEKFSGIMLSFTLVQDEECNGWPE